MLIQTKISLISLDFLHNQTHRKNEQYLKKVKYIYKNYIWTSDSVKTTFKVSFIFWATYPWMVKRDQGVKIIADQ